MVIRKIGEIVVGGKHAQHNQQTHGRGGGGSDAAMRRQIAEGKFDYGKMQDPKSAEHQFLKKEVIQACKDVGVTPGRSRGYCDQVSVAMWDNLGKPEALRPHSVMFVEDEHVLLHNPKSGALVDPTGSQFGQRVFNFKDESPYKPAEDESAFYRLTDREIADVRRIGNRPTLTLNKEDL